MNEAAKILNVTEGESLGHTVKLNDLTISQLNQIKVTAKSIKHYMYVSFFVFEDDSYICVERDKI